MSTDAGTIDRAMWERYSVNNRDHCEVCGRRAQVVVILTASELGAGKSARIASRSVYYCDTHGQQRYGDSLRKLLGTEVLKT